MDSDLFSIDFPSIELGRDSSDISFLGGVVEVNKDEEKCVCSACWREKLIGLELRSIDSFSSEPVRVCFGP